MLFAGIIRWERLSNRSPKMAPKKKITEIGIFPWFFWSEGGGVGGIFLCFLDWGGRLWYFRDCLVCLLGEGDRDISVIVGCVGCCWEGRRWRNGRKVARKCREMNTGIRGTWCLGREWEETVRWKEESSTNKNTAKNTNYQDSWCLLQYQPLSFPKCHNTDNNSFHV